MDIRRIFEADTAGRQAMAALLAKQGLGLDRNLDYSLGLFDDEDRLIATGSFYRNTLRCLAVDSAHQGEGLLAQLVSPLIGELYARGQSHLFVYTKRDAAPSIAPLGFWPIAATDDIVFMENQRHGFQHYLDGLAKPVEGAHVPLAGEEGNTTRNAGDAADLPMGMNKGTSDHALPISDASLSSGSGQLGALPSPSRASPGGVGAIVMNANPFTLGHLYLVEQALSAVGTLHLFIVSEDVSAFSFALRQQLIMTGTAHLQHIRYHPTGPYLVSSATFPSYFIKESDALTLAQARIDAQVFIRIAQALHITHRFVGEEPLSPATALYNQAMGEELPPAGIALHILPRKQTADGPISATRVRALLQAGDMEGLRELVPESTYDFLKRNSR